MWIVVKLARKSHRLAGTVTVQLVDRELGENAVKCGND